VPQVGLEPTTHGL